MDISINKMNAMIYLSYLPIKDNLWDMLEDNRKLAYKHTVKADAIDEKYFEDSAKKVFGIMYDIKGNAASPIQFVVTDSVNHFLRGSLYFNTHPNKDSLAPVIAFLQDAMIEMRESVECKK